MLIIFSVFILLDLEEFKLNTLWIMNLKPAAEMSVLLTPLRFTFTQVNNQRFYSPQTYFSIHTSTKVQNASTFTISGVGLAQVCKAAHTRRDDRSKWVDQWMGFATDGFCSPRCSKKEEELFTATTKKMEIQQRPRRKAPGTSLLFKSHVLHLRKQFICLCSI